MPIKHVDTHIEGTQRGATMTMRFANAPEIANATATVEIKVPFTELNLAEVPESSLGPGTYAHTRFQIAALRHVRDALTAEIERLSNPQGH